MTDVEVARLIARLDARDGSAVAPTLDYLEADPYYFRSGYARTKLVGRLGGVWLTDGEAERARALVLAAVDGTAHCGLSGVARLARSVADNGLRRSLRDRLRATDAAVAGRALRVIVRVPHPGMTRVELAAARSLVLSDAGRQPYLAPSVARLARWLWSPEWSGSWPRSRVGTAPTGRAPVGCWRPLLVRGGGGRAPEAAHQRPCGRNPGPPSASVGPERP